MSPEELGAVALSMTFVTFTTQVIMGGLQAGIGRYFSIAKKSKELDAYFLAVKKIMLTVVFFIFSAGLVTILILYYLDFDFFTISIATLFLAISSCYNSTFNNIMNVARKRFTSSFFLNIDIWLKITIIILISNFWIVTEESVLISYALSATIVLLLYVLHGKLTKIKCKNESVAYKRMSKQIWRYAIPFFPWTILVWMQQASEKWFLQMFTSLSDVGIYAVLYMLGFAPVLMAFSIVIKFFHPVMYDSTTVNKGGVSVNLKTLLIIRIIIISGVLVSFASFLFVDIFHANIFQLLVSEEYWPHSVLLKWFVLSGVLFGTAEILLMKIQNDMKVKVLSVAKSITGITGIIINFIGVYIAGLNGLIGALVIFSVINLLILIYAIWSI